MDQADRLRELVRTSIEENPRLDPGIPLVVVSGCRPEVGASTIAIELARHLERLGKRSVLVDANPQAPRLAELMKIEFHTGLSEVLRGERTAGETLRPASFGVKLLPAKFDPQNPPPFSKTTVRQFLAALHTLRSEADLIILDAGHGLSPWSACLWQAAAHVLLVAKPDSEAVLEAYTVVKLAPHAEVAGKLRLVLNQSENLTRAQRVARQFADTCRKFLEYEINLAEPVGIALPTTPSRNSAYEQPLRLLAADILSDSTVYAARHKTYQASAVQALS